MLRATNTHGSSSVTFQPRLFTLASPSLLLQGSFLCEHNPSLSLDEEPHRPCGKAHAYTSRLNPSLCGSQGRAQQDSWQDAGDAAMLCAAGLPPRERRILQGLSHDADTFTSADSCLALALQS